MLGVRFDAVFDETLDGAEVRTWSVVAPRLGKRGAVPRVREDVRAPLAWLGECRGDRSTALTSNSLRACRRGGCTIGAGRVGCLNAGRLGSYLGHPARFTMPPTGRVGADGRSGHVLRTVVAASDVFAPATRIVVGLPRLGRHCRGWRSGRRGLGTCGRLASSSLRRLLKRVETLLDRGDTAFERIDSAQPHRDVVEAVFQPVNCPVHYPPRSVDELSECVLAFVCELRDEVPVVRRLLRGRHARRIARLIPLAKLQVPGGLPIAGSPLEDGSGFVRARPALATLARNRWFEVEQTVAELRIRRAGATGLNAGTTTRPPVTCAPDSGPEHARCHRARNDGRTVSRIWVTGDSEDAARSASAASARPVPRNRRRLQARQAAGD